MAVGVHERDGVMSSLDLAVFCTLVGNIELHHSFIGRGLSGTVEVEPTLSWRDKLALEATAENTRATAGATAAMADAIHALEQEIGLRLQQQTERLEEQTNLLADIAASVRNPLGFAQPKRLWPRESCFGADSSREQPRPPRRRFAMIPTIQPVSRLRDGLAWDSASSNPLTLRSWKPLWPPMATKEVLR